MTVWREDQRLCCAVGFGAQNTTFCMAGQRSHADPRPAPNQAARRTFSLTFSITQHVMSSHRRGPMPTANPVRCGWLEDRRRATSPSML